MLEWLRNLLSSGDGSVAADEDLPPLSAPFDLVTAPGNAALRTWSELRTRQGLHPVLLGNREAAEGALEVHGFHEQEADEILEQGLHLEVEGWLEARAAEDPAYYTPDETVASHGPSPPAGAFTQAFDTLSASRTGRSSLPWSRRTCRGRCRPG